MPRLGKVLTSARGKCPWWDHTITLCSAPSHINLHPCDAPHHLTVSLQGHPLHPSLITPHWLPSPYLPHPPASAPPPLHISLFLFYFFSPPTLCLCSCVVRRNEVVTHNQPRPTPCYIYIHSYYPPTHPLCKETHALEYMFVIQYASSDTCKRKTCTDGGYKFWAAVPRPTTPYPTTSPIPPPPSPPTTDDGVLPAGDAVNFISIVGSVNIGGLSTLSTLPSASQFSSNCIALQPI